MRRATTWQPVRPSDDASVAPDALACCSDTCGTSPQQSATAAVTAAVVAAVVAAVAAAVARQLPLLLRAPASAVMRTLHASPRTDHCMCEMDARCAGDRGGRVVVFEVAQKDQSEPETVPHTQYNFLTEFQSHEPEFDYLKSLEIDEKIASLRWCKGNMGCKLLLTTNDKTIKLWKIYGKAIKTLSQMNLDPISADSGVPTGAHGLPPQPPPTVPGSPSSPSAASAFERTAGRESGHSPTAAEQAARFGMGGLKGDPLTASLYHAGLRGLKLPQMATCERVTTASVKRLYSNGHSYHIHSLSVNADGESFFSCDDLRINLWHLSTCRSSFNIVDLKPSNLETLSEVLTTVHCHPTHGHSFLYATSRGAVRLADMRAAALCEKHSKVLAPSLPPASATFFTDLTSSVSTVKFLGDGRYVAARDFMSVHVWDTHMDRRPVFTFSVHDELTSHLVNLYEQGDALFERFEVSASRDGRYLLTGSHSHTCKIYDLATGTLATTLCASTNPHSLGFSNNASRSAGTFLPLCAFHPTRDALALASTSSLYLFNAYDPSQASDFVGASAATSMSLEGEERASPPADSPDQLPLSFGDGQLASPHPML